EKHQNESTGPTRGQIGRMFSTLALTQLFFGESVCSGIPFSTSFQGGFTYGHAISKDSVLHLTAENLDSALAYSVDTLRFLSLARVLKARVLLDMDSVQAAAALVAGVSTDFTYPVEFNQNWWYNYAGYYFSYGYESVADKK